MFNRIHFLTTLAFVLVLTGSGCSRNVHEPSAELTHLSIHVGEGLGNVRFGDSEEAVIQKFGPPDSKRGGRVLVYVRGGFEVYLSRDGKRVTMFACGSADPERAVRFKGKTPEGIGVGSSVADVQSAFGTPSLKRKKDEGGRSYEDLIYKDKHLKVTASEGKVLLIIYGNEAHAMFR